MIEFESKEFFIFDLDGTLVNSNDLHEKAFLKTLMGHDVSFEYSKFHGQKTLDVFKDLGFSKDDCVRLTQQKQAIYRNYIKEGEIKEIHGASDLLKFLFHSNLKIYLCTGASRSSSEMVLNSLGWRNYFSDIICGDEVAESKPSPLILNTLINLNKLDKAKVLYLEDSYNGVLTGENACVDTVVINNLFPGKICFENLATFKKKIEVSFLLAKEVG